MNGSTAGTFREWLTHRVLFFHKEDTATLRLSTFVGGLWAIWLLRNEQVFRGSRPTLHSIITRIKITEELVAQFDQTRNPRDPTTPPGFQCANLGQHVTHPGTFVVQIDGVWNKKKKTRGLAWVNSLNSTSETPFLGDFCHANSALATKATACLNTIQWAKDTGHMNLRILTDSYRLVHLLATTDTKDITLKWTLTKIRTLGMVFQTCKYFESRAIILQGLLS